MRSADKREAERRARVAKMRALEQMPLTVEEMDRWSGILRDTWQSIAPDVLQALDEGPCGLDEGELTPDIVIEITLDANRPEDYGMTHAEYEYLCVVSHTAAGKAFLTATLGGYA